MMIDAGRVIKTMRITRSEIAWLSYEDYRDFECVMSRIAAQPGIVVYKVYPDVENSVYKIESIVPCITNVRAVNE